MMDGWMDEFSLYATKPEPYVSPALLPVYYSIFFKTEFGTICIELKEH